MQSNYAQSNATYDRIRSTEGRQPGAILCRPSGPLCWHRAGPPGDPGCDPLQILRAGASLPGVADLPGRLIPWRDPLYMKRKGENMNKFNKQEYDNNYIKENKDRLNFVMPKGHKAIINEAAKNLGISAAEFVRLAIRDKLVSCGVKLEETVDKSKS